MEVAARGDEFILRCCRLADAPERGTFSLQFRLAAVDCHCDPCPAASPTSDTRPVGDVSCDAAMATRSAAASIL